MNVFHFFVKYCLCILLILNLIACTQEGQVGPRGIQGSQIHHGVSEPTNEIGMDGDYYFNKQTGDFYGPKSNGNWGQPFNIKGAKGDPGKDGVDGQTGSPGIDGKTILSGIVNPSNTVGTAGDFYINLQTSDFFGPKTTSGWGTAINLKGLSGTIIHNGSDVPGVIVGNIGDYFLDKNNGLLYGPKTPTGWGVGLNLIGSKGESGNTIRSGEDIPDILMGNIGDFYYRTTSNDFFGPKTVTGWGSPINLKSIPASTILNGENAPPQSKGSIGDFYINTTTWEISGPKSASGWGRAVPLIGQKGDAGIPGTPGTAGSKILVGTSNPLSSDGGNGDFYINTFTGDLFGPKANDLWSSSIFNMRSGQITDVIYSDWISPNQNDIVEEGPNLASYTVRIPEMSLDPSLINSALFVVYVQESNVSLQHTGTFQLNYQSSVWNLYVYFSLQESGIKVFYSGTFPRIGYDRAYKIRYVIIPGNKKSLLATNFNRSYSDLKALYKIPN